MVDARPRLKMLEKVFLAAIASRQDGLAVWLHEGVQVVVSGYIERPLVVSVGAHNRPVIGA